MDSKFCFFLILNFLCVKNGTSKKDDVSTKLKEIQLSVNALNILVDQIVQSNNETEWKIDSLEKQMQNKVDELEQKTDAWENRTKNISNQLGKFVALKDFNQKLAAFSKKVERQVKELVEKAVEGPNHHFHHLQPRVENRTKHIENDTHKLKVHQFNESEETIVNNITEILQDGSVISKASDVRLLNDKMSIDKLLDSFLFGSADEQMAFEALCSKWTIKHFDRLQPNVEYWSDVYSVYGYDLKAQLKLTMDPSGFVGIYLCFKDDERKGQEVNLKLAPIVTFIFKDLSGRKQKRNTVRYYYFYFKNSLQYNHFHYQSYIKRSEWTELISPKDRSLEVLVLVEPMTNISLLSTDGSVTDTIDNYEEKIKMAKEELIGGHWSAPFLTHAGGYKVAVKMHLNKPMGNRRSGLVAWIRFLSDEIDAEDEFNHETSITLINTRNTTKNITVKKQLSDVDWYLMEIAYDEAISAGRFIVNDSLTYHVTIKPIK